MIGDFECSSEVSPIHVPQRSTGRCKCILNHSLGYRQAGVGSGVSSSSGNCFTQYTWRVQNIKTLQLCRAATGRASAQYKADRSSRPYWHTHTHAIGRYITLRHLQTRQGVVATFSPSFCSTPLSANTSGKVFPENKSTLNRSHYNPQS